MPPIYIGGKPPPPPSGKKTDNTRNGYFDNNNQNGRGWDNVLPGDYGRPFDRPNIRSGDASGIGFIGVAAVLAVSPVVRADQLTTAAFRATGSLLANPGQGIGAASGRAAWGVVTAVIAGQALGYLGLAGGPLIGALAGAVGGVLTQVALNYAQTGQVGISKATLVAALAGAASGAMGGLLTKHLTSHLLATRVAVGVPMGLASGVLGGGIPGSWSNPAWVLYEGDFP
jgi:hypothetical protein